MLILEKYDDYDQIDHSANCPSSRFSGDLNNDLAQDRKYIKLQFHC